MTESISSKEGAADEGGIETWREGQLLNEESLVGSERGWGQGTKEITLQVRKEKRNNTLHCFWACTVLGSVHLLLNPGSTL